ncbi:VWA domain-containing protein [Conchiformibius steedae DSM 2580]|uniref:VWA domain-containing protein n=1 Tax=Conchiformibius steedae DSM 2580 TaxID=1121352 RepID=A0AAE9HYF7_9NEIS|nr:VWA domain-containing protein [Conchiformibius steedae]QMT33581.1 VWA domain-containing protein [Conchiformibius steedae]URD68240.1 VWA domain-containing protein [Conchiformibius steedae DSM 2580]
MFRLRLLAVLVALSACAPHSPPPPPSSDHTAVADDLSVLGRMTYRLESLPVAYGISPQAAPIVSHAHIRTASLAVNTERYGNTPENPIHRTVQTPVSTFSIDVDTGSYANTRRYLNNQSLPPANAVRAEEIINYFDYGYAQPTDGKPFAVHTETVDSPWQADAKIIKIGIKAKDWATKQLPPANLVFLVDVSGSMDTPEKLPLVKHTLNLLLEQMRPQDKITLITYASGEKLVLPPTSGSEKDTIRRAIEQLEADGATAGEQAIQMAYREAQKSFIHNGINRILLATDGDFNVGVTDFDTLKNMVAEKRKSGISLTTLGFGTGNYNEHMMEQLADAGDGNYSYIDTEKEAQKVLTRQLSSTLATVAKDVKIQVEFNPATVKEYRLIGYENRALKEEDFNNDRVDAGDIGAGHSVTALYEIVPVGKKGWLDDNRYQATAAAQGKSHEYALLKLRYKLPTQQKSHLISQTIAAKSKPLAQAGTDTRFALAAAAYAQQLKGGKYNGNMGWQNIFDLAKQSAHPDRYGLRQEFLDLIQTAQSLSAKPQQQ